MRSVLMVVADILCEEALQVALVEGDNMVQQIAPTTLNPPLSNSVLPRTAERGAYWSYAHRAHCYRDLQTILRISIEDQKPGGRMIWEGLAQLLDDPQARGMLRN